MAQPSTSRTQKLYTTDDAQASVSYEGSKVSLSLSFDRDVLSGLLERWTWNEATVTIRSGDRDVAIIFPKIEERTSR